MAGDHDIYEMCHYSQSFQKYGGADNPSWQFFVAKRKVTLRAQGSFGQIAEGRVWIISELQGGKLRCKVQGSLWLVSARDAISQIIHV